MRVLAELAEAAALVKRDRRRFIAAHFEGESRSAVATPVSLRSLQERSANAAAEESRVDRERVYAQSPGAPAQRNQNVARHFIIDDRSSYRPMGGPEEFA